MDPTALGRYLRESREAKEKTLDDAVNTLKIRRNILEGFERGEFEITDTPVRVRGMLRNYAHFLELDEEYVLQYYESAQNPKNRSRRAKKVEMPQAPRRITDTPPALPVVKIQEPRSVDFGSILRTLGMVIVSLMAIGIIAFVVIEMFIMPEVDPDSVVIQATELQADGTITATYTATWTPAPTTTVNFAIQGVTGIQVDLSITQRSWVRISLDGVEEYTGMLEPGFSARYDANSTLQIIAANATALDITYNGIDLPTYGVRGQQVQLNFTPDGVTAVGEGVQETITPTELLPTSTPTLAPTITATINTPVVIGGGDSTQSNVVVATVTPLFADQTVPSPTSLFDVVPTVEGGVIATTAPIVTATPTELPVTATETPEPSPSAILPIRATPTNPTPTKPG